MVVGLSIGKHSSVVYVSVTPDKVGLISRTNWLQLPKYTLCQLLSVFVERGVGLSPSHVSSDLPVSVKSSGIQGQTENVLERLLLPLQLGYY